MNPIMRRNPKKAPSLGIIFLILCLFLLPAAAYKVNPFEFELLQDNPFGFAKAHAKQFKAKNIYVYNLSDDKQVFAKNENARVAPASLTKIMTTYTALQHISDLSAIAPIDKESYQRMVALNSSMAGFYGNEKTTYRDLLYGTMLASGGECANSLAINISGNNRDFVVLMNENAKQMGLTNTHYTNVEGMDEKDHYSSAKDVAKLLKQALENGHFRAIFTKVRHQSTKTAHHPDGIIIESTVLGELEFWDQNGFEVIGGKSGTTLKAGQCWATIAQKDAKEYLVVVMGVPLKDLSKKSDTHIIETLKILEEIV